jgi:hypothetical protein
VQVQFLQDVGAVRVHRGQAETQRGRNLGSSHLSKDSPVRVYFSIKRHVRHGDVHYHHVRLVVMDQIQARGAGFHPARGCQPRNSTFPHHLP